MTQENTGSPRKGLIIAAAATALTVAAGVTAGALLGYVGPAGTTAASAPPAVTPSELREVAMEPALAAPPRERARGVEERDRERGEHERGEHERGEHERGEHEEHGEDDD